MLNLDLDEDLFFCLILGYFKLGSLKQAQKKLKRQDSINLPPKSGNGVQFRASLSGMPNSWHKIRFTYGPITIFLS